MNVRVNILNRDIKIPYEIIEAAGGDELLARIFFNRGYKDPWTIRQMLDEKLYEPTLASEFPSIDRAVAIISKALEENRKICVYGDYDVDGVTSTAILVECLRIFTDEVVYHVPDRFTEGYGMNEEVIRRLYSEGVSLIITCDCGISNVNEIDTAKNLGMSVILTDHHTIPAKLPKADVILNPKLLEEGHRARNISGCGMAYFLCLALLKSKGMEDRAEEGLDLLALSLIADVVSLNGENRYLLKKGLPRLLNTKRVGLGKLFDIAGKNGEISTEEDIAFQIAPRINAAGRMESARLPVELMLCKNPEEAQAMAEKIDFLNMERKSVQQRIIEEAVQMVETRKKNKTVLVLFGEFWHHGIIGIAAGRICELYKKPAILLSMKEDGSTVVGSARSIEKINIYDLISKCQKRLLKFGGHSQAAGLSLKKEDLEAFTREIELEAERKHYIKDEINVSVDVELDLEDINEEFYDRIIAAGPYGEGFEPPQFYSASVSVISDRRTEKNHHIMVLENNRNLRILAVKWFGENEPLTGKKFDITYKLSKNTYRGNNSIQLTLGYLIEGSQAVRKAFEGRIIDERGKKIEGVVEKYEGARVFYEGLLSSCSLANTFDRYGIARCENLVFLSPPANTGIFREVIALSEPGNVIINFSIIPDYSFKGFITNFLGLAKNTINREFGKAQVEMLAMRLCVEEAVVKACLKYLKARGILDYIYSEDETWVYMYKCDRPQEGTVQLFEKNLKNALMEKNAYLQFILKMEIDKFMEYLK